MASPAVTAALRRYARTLPEEVRPYYIATAIVESGLRPDAVGDGGNSVGLFQENIRGRGAGRSFEDRANPDNNARRAAEEFMVFYNRGARGADLAYRAQRPADRNGYIRKVEAALARARTILGQPDTGQPVGTGAPASPETVATAAGPQTTQQGSASGGFGNALLEGLAQRRPGESLARTLAGAVVTGALQKSQIDQQGAAGAAGRAQQPGHEGRDHGPGAPTGERIADIGPSGLAPILPGQPQWGSYGYSDPEGQGGRHLAVDWFAKAGTPFASPVDGRVVRVTPDPTPGRRASGQVFGGTISIRDKHGRLFVMRHGVPDNFRVGQQVSAGQRLGTVKDWGPSSHIHFETYRAGSSDREYGSRYAINPRDLYR